MPKFDFEEIDSQLFGEKANAGYALLWTWGMVEAGAFALVAGAFGILPEDEKAKILEEVPLARKLRFLRDNKVINAKEYQILDNFREERNALFHRHGIRVINYIVDKKKDRELVQKCFEVFALMIEILERTPAMEATYRQTRNNTQPFSSHPHRVNSEESQK
jgi:hypothetical protein